MSLESDRPEKTEKPKMTLKQMKDFEHLMQLKDLKAGDVITERQIDAIEHFFGDSLEHLRALKPTVATIKFTDKGEPYTTDGNPLGVTVDGKKPLDLHDERQPNEPK